MAEKKDKRISPVMNMQDGYGLVSKLEGEKLNQMLQTYTARVEAYKVDEFDNYIKITMKIMFPRDTKQSNANLWTFLIAGAMHSSVYKPNITTYPEGDHMLAYISWNFYPSVKFIESKRPDETGF